MARTHTKTTRKNRSRTTPPVRRGRRRRHSSPDIGLPLGARRSHGQRTHARSIYYTGAKRNKLGGSPISPGQLFGQGDEGCA
eukprot:13074445-Alexandrium_andersonii.AAC.1